MRRGIMAFEEMVVGGESNIAGLGNIEMVTSPESVENTMCALVDSGNECQLRDSYVTDGLAAQQTLYDISAVVSESETMFSVPATQALELAVESMMRLNGLRKSSPVFCVENFKNGKAQAASKAVALEGIKELAARIGNAIRLMFQKAIAWISDFANKLMLSTKGLTKRASSLVASARSLTATNSEPKQAAYVSSARLASFLEVAKGDTSPKGFAHTVEQHCTLSIRYMQQVNKICDNARQSCDNIGSEKKLSLLGPADKELYTQVIDALSPLISKAPNTPNKDVLAKYDTKISQISQFPYVFGNASLVVVLVHENTVSHPDPTSQQSADIQRALGACGFYVHKGEYIDGHNRDKIEPLPPAISGTVATTVLHHLEKITSSQLGIEVQVTALRKSSDQFLKHANTMANMHESDRSTIYSIARGVALALTRFCTTGQSALRIYDFGVLKHILDYVAASQALCTVGNSSVDANSAYGNSSSTLLLR